MVFAHPVFEGALIGGCYGCCQQSTIKIPLNTQVSNAEINGGPDFDVCFHLIGLVNQGTCTFQNGGQWHNAVKCEGTALNSIDNYMGIEYGGR